jgi:hypothetical protein
MVGPEMKSPSSSTTNLRRWRHPPPAAIGAVCPQAGANTLFQSLRNQTTHQKTNLQRAAHHYDQHGDTACWFLSSQYQEIGTRMSLTESTTRLTKRTVKNNYYHLISYLRQPHEAFDRKEVRRGQGARHNRVVFPASLCTVGRLRRNSFMSLPLNDSMQPFSRGPPGSI